MPAARFGTSRSGAMTAPSGAGGAWVGAPPAAGIGTVCGPVIRVRSAGYRSLGDRGLLVRVRLRGGVDVLRDDRVLLRHGGRLRIDRADVGRDGRVDRGRD